MAQQRGIVPAMTPDTTPVPIYSREFTALAVAVHDATDALRRAVDAISPDDVPINLENGLVRVGEHISIPINDRVREYAGGAELPAAAPPAEDKPKTRRARKPKAEPAPEPGPGHPEYDAKTSRTEATIGPAETVADDKPEAPPCPVDSSHTLEYCEGSCEEVRRIANEATDDEPPFVAEEAPAAEETTNFYMVAEEIENGSNPTVWRLILYIEGQSPIVKGRHASAAFALRAANDVRLECVGKKWTEVRPIKAIPLEPPF